MVEANTQGESGSSCRAAAPRIGCSETRAVVKRPLHGALDDTRPPDEPKLAGAPAVRPARRLSRRVRSRRRRARATSRPRPCRCAPRRWEGRAQFGQGRLEFGHIVFAVDERGLAVRRGGRLVVDQLVAGDRDLANAVLGAADTRHLRDDDCAVVACVQVAPLPLAAVVGATLLPALGVWQAAPLANFDEDPDLLLPSVDVDARDASGRLQPENLGIDAATLHPDQATSPAAERSWALSGGPATRSPEALTP
ncbi:hypothetical protein Pla163_00210 [Planctomycetes bacterium Pla163]|uniref:Uncharacterized protein n=1 Tax=Rohdeia mirabilis TaxID=2528008 RepID=A0A518CUM7_9BACT|nr:hypothetical protein Pla163_00210 [Planctomycetes bacterium Pla163]